MATNAPIVWDDEQEGFDLLGDIQTNLPGVKITSGYRTPEYQEEMRKRGYKPARNSAHLYGDAIDIGAFPNMTLEQGAAFLREKYPNARVRYGDRNHQDHVHFSLPGYGKFPVFGRAAAEGVQAPADEIQWDDEQPSLDPKITVQAEAPETETYIRNGFDPKVESPEVSKKIEDYYVSALQDPNIPLSEINLQMRRMAAEEGTPLMGDAFDVKAAEEYRRKAVAGEPVSTQVGYENYTRVLPLRPETLENPEERSDIGLMAEEGLLYNPMNIGVNALKDFTDAEISGGLTKEKLAERFPDATPEQLEQIHDTLIGEDLRRQRTAVSQELDKRSSGLGFEAARFGVSLPTGLSPADIVPFGRGASLAARGVEAVAANQAIDLAMQAGDLSYGAQDQFSPTQNILAGLAGAGFHAGLESIGYGIRRVAGRGVNDNGSYIDVETPQGEYKRVYRDEKGTVEDIAPEEITAEGTPFEETGEVPEFLKNPVKAKKYGSSKPRTKAKAAEKVIGQKNEDVRARVDDLTQDWTNSPEFLIVNNVDELDDKLAAEITADKAENALGVTLPDGRVLLMIDNIKSAEKVDAVVFHEALGHVGLNTRYGEGLDDLLVRMDEGNESLRADVDAWIERNGADAYGGNRARAVEEVLAEASEAGNIDPSLWNTIKAYISRFAREIGLRKGTYSDAEVREILRQGHERIINGDLGISSIPGVRYMKDSEREPGKLKWNPGKQKQRGMIGNVSGNRFKSKRAVHDVLREAASEAPKLVSESFANLDARARELDMGFDEIMELNTGMDPAEAHAVGIALVQRAEKVERLAGAIARGEATDIQKSRFMESYLELAAIYEQYARIANNAGRLLASFKIAKQSSSNERLRFMREDAESAMNAGEGGVESLARRIHQGETSVGKSIRENSRSSDALSNALNLPRTLMSSTDLSAPLRQGIFLITTKNYWKAFARMFEYMGSDRAFQALQDNIRLDPNFIKMREAGLSFTDTEGHNLATIEEDFQSEWAKRIPGVGKLVKGSERAFVGFLNKLRQDTFNQYLRDFERAGEDINDPVLLRAMGSFINAATGRGNLPDGKGRLPDMRGAAPLLNGAFFSPRLISSRITLLNPAYYGKLPAPVQKQAIKNLLGFLGVAATTAGLAAMAGFDVETDPRSSDFMKIRDGTKRFDILGGFGQFMTLYARIFPELFAHAGVGEGGKIKTIKGDIVDIEPGIANRSGWDVFVDFYRNKASPIASLFVDLMEGENAIGERVSLHEPFSGTKEGEDPIDWNKNAIVQRMLPIFVQDLFEVINEEGIEGIPYLAPSLFGIGYSDFDAVPSDSPLREANNPDNLVAKELTRVGEATDKKVFGTFSKKYSVDGVEITMSDEEYEQYIRTADQYILEDLEILVNDPSYQSLSDEEKLEEMRDVGKEARKAAREDMFMNEESEEGIVWDDQN